MSGHDQASAEGRRDAVLTLSLAHKVAGLIGAGLTAAVSVGGSYLVHRALTDYRISDGEKRIERLENQKGDQTALIVSEQSRQIGDLTRNVAADHDVLIRLATVLERQTRGN